MTRVWYDVLMPKILGASEWSQRAAGHDDPMYLHPETPGLIEAIDCEHLPKLDHKPKTTGSRLAEERDFVRQLLAGVEG